MIWKIKELDRKSGKNREKIGKEIGEKIGKFAEKISSIRRKKGKFDEYTLVDLYDIDKERCRKIIFYIEKYPEMKDEDIADKLLGEEEE